MISKRAILTDVATARDEARVRMQLLSMEARECWHELETALDAVEHKLHGEALSASVIDAARGIIRSVRQFPQSDRRALGATGQRLLRCRRIACGMTSQAAHIEVTP